MLASRRAVSKINDLALSMAGRTCLVGHQLSHSPRRSVVPVPHIWCWHRRSLNKRATHCWVLWSFLPKNHSTGTYASDKRCSKSKIIKRNITQKYLKRRGKTGFCLPLFQCDKPVTSWMSQPLGQQLFRCGVAGIKPPISQENSTKPYPLKSWRLKPWKRR